MLQDVFLFFFFLLSAAPANFVVSFQYIAGTDNAFAYSLSRGQFARFLEMAPDVHHEATAINIPNGL